MAPGTLVSAVVVTRIAGGPLAAVGDLTVADGHVVETPAYPSVHVERSP